MSDKTSATSRVLVDRATSWLLSQALTDADLETIVRGCCERLHGAGIPLARVHLSFSVLHPLYRALGFTWRHKEGLQVEGYRHTPDGKTNDRFKVSPYYHMMKHKLEHLRRKLDADAYKEFPIFGDLHKEGLTDYLAFVAPFDAAKQQGMMGSWSTNSREGFSDDEIEALISVQDRLAVAAKMAVRGDVAKSALMTYLGPNAGQRVLSGQIKRGDGETIRAAIVWGDLRNSTAMAEQLGRQVYIDNLNTFFDNVAGSVADAGGEILDFVGDGFLAIFPCERNQKEFHRGLPDGAGRRHGGGQPHGDRQSRARQQGRAGAGLRPRAAYRQCHVRQCGAGRPAFLLGVRLGGERGDAAGAAYQEIRLADHRQRGFQGLLRRRLGSVGQRDPARQRESHGRVQAGRRGPAEPEPSTWCGATARGI